MGSRRRIESDDPANRRTRAQQDLRFLMESFSEAFAPMEKDGRITSVGQGAIERLLGTELRLAERFGPRFEDVRSRIAEQRIENDPRLRQLDRISARGLGTIFQGLQGLNEPGALPSDVRANLQESVRGAQAARGVLDSSAGAVQEAARLAGGTEAFRASRISQALPFISAGTQIRQAPQRSFGVVGQFAPGPAQLLGAQLQSQQIGQQAEFADTQLALQADQARAELIKSGILLAGSVATGGALGAAGAVGFGGGFGSGALTGLGAAFGIPAQNQGGGGGFF